MSGSPGGGGGGGGSPSNATAGDVLDLSTSPRRFAPRAALARRARVKEGLFTGTDDLLPGHPSPSSPRSNLSAASTSPPPIGASSSPPMNANLQQCRLCSVPFRSDAASSVCAQCASTVESSTSSHQTQQQQHQQHHQQHHTSLTLPERDSFAVSLALVGQDVTSTWSMGVGGSPRSTDMAKSQLLSAGVQRRPSLLSFRCEQCQADRVSARVVDSRSGQAWLLCKRCKSNFNSTSPRLSPQPKLQPSSPLSKPLANAPPSSPPAKKPAEKKKRERCMMCVLRGVAARVTLGDGRTVRVCKDCAVRASRDPAFSESLERAGLIYGEPLDVVLRRESASSQLAPLVVLRMASYVVRSGAIKDEGVFRIAGRKDVIDALRAEVESTGMAPTAIELRRRKADPHCVTAALKLYLRMLPEALLTSRLWTPLLDVASVIDDKGIDAGGTARTRLLALLGQQLPPTNRAVLAVVLFLLTLAIAHSDTTRMSVLNAAICISPTILYEPPSDLSAMRDPVALRQALEPARLAARMAAATKVIACLVRYYHDTFAALLGDGAEMLRALARLDGEQQLYFSEVVQRLQTRLATESPQPTAPARTLSAAKIRPALPSKAGLPPDVVSPPSPSSASGAATMRAPSSAALAVSAERLSSWKAASHTQRQRRGSIERNLSRSAAVERVSMIEEKTGSAPLPSEPLASTRRSRSSQTVSTDESPVVERATSVSSDFGPIPLPIPPRSLSRAPSQTVPLPTLSPPAGITASPMSRPQIIALDLSASGHTTNDLYMTKRCESGSSLMALDLHAHAAQVPRYAPSRLVVDFTPSSQRETALGDEPPELPTPPSTDDEDDLSMEASDELYTDSDSSLEVHDLGDSRVLLAFESTLQLPLPVPPEER